MLQPFQMLVILHLKITAIRVGNDIFTTAPILQNLIFLAVLLQSDITTNCWQRILRGVIAFTFITNYIGLARSLRILLGFLTACKLLAPLAPFSAEHTHIRLYPPLANALRVNYTILRRVSCSRNTAQILRRNLLEKKTHIEPPFVIYAYSGF